MKDFEVEVRIRNNHLKQRRIGLGLTQVQLAKAVGVTQTTYGPLECLRENPMNRHGEWRDAPKKIANFFCVEPEELWPQEVLDVDKAVAVKKMDAVEFVSLGAAYSAGKLLDTSMEDAAEGKQMASRVKEMVNSGVLSERETDVIESRFGLVDGTAQTLEAIGKRQNVTREIIRQIEARALSKLRGSKNYRKLKSVVSA